jgi:magnesium transporter
MLGRAILPEINELIQGRDFQTLKEIFDDWHPSEIADAVEDLQERERAIVFRLLSRDRAAEVFEYLAFDVQKSLLKAMGQGEVGEILNQMSADDRTAFLQELPGPIVRQLIDLLSANERSIARSLLGYPEGSVGRLMTPEYVAVTSDWTIERLIQHIRTHGSEIESFDVIYVVDERGKLVDDLRLRDVLTAPPGSTVQSIMDEQLVQLKATDSSAEAVETFKQYNRSVLPVTDKDGFLLGIVTIDDALHVVEEIDTEDIQKFGGVEALDYPYVRTPLLELVKKRAGWLVILFLGELLTATAMGYFEEAIARAVVLALFVPLIISSGGNSGSQAATLIIRAMALKELTLADWWMVMRREVISGLILGTVLGSIGFLRIGIWSIFSPIYGPHWALVGATVSFSLVGIVMWGTFSGSMLPFLLRRFGFDPASSSAPFVATLVDVTGLIIYFSVAGIILQGTLL